MRRENEPLDPRAHHDLRSLLKRVADLDESGADIPEDVAKDFLDTAVMTSWLQLRRGYLDDQECLVMLRDRLEKSANQVEAVIALWERTNSQTSRRPPTDS